MRVFVFVCLALCLTSCATLEKRINKAKVLAYEHQKEFAGFCSDAFPMKEKYIKGKDSIITKTVTIKGDTIPCPPNENGEIVKVICPDVKYIDTGSVRVDTAYIENTAKITALEHSKNKIDTELTITKDKLTEANKSANTRLWILIGMAVAIVALIVLLFRK